jgi:hypothetical protein
MHSAKTRFAVVAIAGTVVTVIVCATVAVATIPNVNGFIQACAAKSSGALRVIDRRKGQNCTSSETALSWSTGRPGLQGVSEYLTSGQWTAPAGVTRVLMEIIGGGGTGGCGATTQNIRAPAGGGGGGAGYLRTVVTVTPGTTYNVNVAPTTPQPCTGDPAQAYTAGPDGADTAFVAPSGAVLAVAHGGRGGGAPPTTTTCDDYGNPIGGGQVADGGAGGTASPNTGQERDGDPGTGGQGFTGGPGCVQGDGGRAQQGSALPPNTSSESHYGDGSGGGLDAPPSTPAAGTQGYADLTW